MPTDRRVAIARPGVIARSGLQARLNRVQRDDGFTMIEVIVALVIIGIIMAALTTFFVSTVSATARQGNKQAAVTVADSAIELVRALKGSAVVAGRDSTSTAALWTAAQTDKAPANLLDPPTPPATDRYVPGISAYIADMTQVSEAGLPATAGPNATLPTVGVKTTINGLDFRQYWYVGSCYQPRGGGACTNTPGPAAFYRVVVAVTWSDKNCTNNTCDYFATTLVSNATSEPIFNSNLVAPSPTVVNPGSQSGDTGIAVSLGMTSTGGAGAVTWTATGLPTGLTMSGGGTIAGTPSATGSFVVTAAATDSFGLTGTTNFNWAIVTPPALTSANQVDEVSTFATYTPAITGGAGTLAWTATGLPAGITMSGGTMSGTPTSGTGATPSAVTVKVTDAQGQSSTTSFTWAINPALTVTAPATQASSTNVAISNVQVASSGGVAPYTWSISGQPTGLNINSSGQIYGIPSAVGSYSPKVTVSDAAGASVTTSSFTWTVTNALVIAAPTGNRVDDTGNAIANVPLTAQYGTGPYTWSATGLPANVTINPSGSNYVLSGAPTTPCSCSVVLTVTDSVGKTATQSFTWTIFSLTVNPANPSTKKNTVGTVTLTAAGGTGSLTWGVTGLPASFTKTVSPNTVDTLSGNIGSSSRTVTVVLTDASGATYTFTFGWAATN